MDSALLPSWGAYSDFSHVPATPQYSSSSTSSNYSSHGRTLSPGLCYTSGARQVTTHTQMSAYRNGNSQPLKHQPTGNGDTHWQTTHRTAVRPQSSLDYYPDTMLSPNTFATGGELGTLNQDIIDSDRYELKMISSAALSVPRPNTTLGFADGMALRSPGGSVQYTHTVERESLDDFDLARHHLQALSRGAYHFSNPPAYPRPLLSTSLCTVEEEEQQRLDAVAGYQAQEVMQAVSSLPQSAAPLSYMPMGLSAAFCESDTYQHADNTLDGQLEHWDTTQLGLSEDADAAVYMQQQQQMLQNSMVQDSMVHYQQQQQLRLALQQAAAARNISTGYSPVDRISYNEISETHQTIATMRDTPGMYQPLHGGYTHKLTIQVPEVHAYSTTGLQVDSNSCTIPNRASAFDDDEQSTGADGAWNHLTSPYHNSDQLREQAGRMLYYDQESSRTAAVPGLSQSQCPDTNVCALLDSTDLEQGPDLSESGQDDGEITYQTLAQVWMKPIQVAASELGISKFRLKKACSLYNITRWPHRKIKCLQNLVIEMQEQGASKVDIEHVRQQLTNVLQNPIAPVTAETKRQLRLYAKKRFVQKHGANKARGSADADEDVNAGEEDWI